MNAIDSLTEQPPTLVVKAVRQVLRPLARLLLSHGVTFPTIAELVKQVLVEVAEKDFPAPGGRNMTDSRISVVSGVHRKDVKRLRALDASDDREAPKTVSLGSKVVNAWITQPRWRDADGRPLPLPRNPSADDGPSFEALAESVSKDVRPRAILDELLRVKVVTLTDDEQVLLNVEAFIPEAGFEEKLFFFQRAAHAHLAAAIHNIEGVQPPFFDRIVHYDSIPADAVEDLRELVDREGMGMLQRVNEQAKAASLPDDPEAQRITFGVYFYAEPGEAPDDSGAS